MAGRGASVRPFLNPRAARSRFWNPYTQTLPRRALDRIHLERLRAAIRFAYDRSPFYRRLLDKAHVHPDQIRTFEDYVKRIPFMDKKDILEAQATDPPYGEALMLPREYLFHAFQTSGSVGTPMHIPIPMYNSVLWGEAWNFQFWAIGARPRDTFYFPFNWGSFAGFWSTYFGIRRFGGTIVSGGGLDTKARIEQLLRIKPDVMLATPTYCLYMGEVAKEMGVDLREARVRFMIVSGEPGGSIPIVRQQIEAIWGSEVHDFYGLAEVGPTCPGCPSGRGVHVAEEFYHSMVVDANGEPVPDGEVGEHILTSYVQHAQLTVKYRSHDLVRWYRRPCECGTTWIFLEGGVLGRTDSMVVIRGINVYPSAVSALLGQVHGLTENYEIHVDCDERSDLVTVKVEAAREVAPERYGPLRQEAEEVLKRTIGVTIGIEVLSPQALPRYELKARRFFDHRPPHRKWLIQR